MTLSSLRDYDRPADRIRQHRQASDAPILIVEGAADRLVLRPHLPGVEIFPADGRTNAVSASIQLLAWSLPCFACVTDRDFTEDPRVDEIEEVHHPYDEVDCYAMLIELGALTLVIEHQ